MVNGEVMSAEGRIETEHFVVEPTAEAVSIAALPPWHFWMRHRTLSSDDIRSASVERQLEIKTELQNAIIHLRDAEVPGFKEWMTQRRARN